MSALGERIKILRKTRGLSQRELAEQIGVHQTEISHVENGRHEMRFQSALRLADALGVSVYDLVPEATELA